MCKRTNESALYTVANPLRVRVNPTAENVPRGIKLLMEDRQYPYQWMVDPKTGNMTAFVEVEIYSKKYVVHSKYLEFENGR